MKQEIIIDLFEDRKFWDEQKEEKSPLLMKKELTQKDHLISQK